MSSNRVTTRAKNSEQHPGLLVPKQTRRTTDEVAASRKAKQDAKRSKEDAKNAGINAVAEFELNQATGDAMERTPRTTKPLVRTRSYADVLRSTGPSADVLPSHETDIDMEDGTTFELTAVNASQVTDMETDVDDLPVLPQRKVNVHFFYILYLLAYNSMKVKSRKAKKPSVRETIKTIQENPAKNLKRKNILKSSDSESVQETPKPRKKNVKRRAATDSDDDLPLAVTPKRVVRPALSNNGDSIEEIPQPRKGEKKNKGKGKETVNKGKAATDKDPDQTRDRNVSK